MVFVAQAFAFVALFARCVSTADCHPLERTTSGNDTSVFTDTSDDALLVQVTKSPPHISKTLANRTADVVSLGLTPSIWQSHQQALSQGSHEILASLMSSWNNKSVQPLLLQLGVGRGDGNPQLAMDWFFLMLLAAAVAFFTMISGYQALWASLDAGEQAAAERPVVDVSPTSQSTPAEPLTRAWRPSWARAAPGVSTEVLPALCTKILQANRDLPLLVPFTAIERGGLWTVDILAGSGRVPLLVACLAEKHGDTRRVVQVWEHGNQGNLLASISSSLEIRCGDGGYFGKLIRGKKEYSLQEGATPCSILPGRAPRWALRTCEDGSLIVTWDCKPAHYVLPFRGVSQKCKSNPSRVVATAGRSVKANVDCLEISSSSGNDAVLTLVCALGIAAFEVTFDASTHEGPHERLDASVEH